MKIAFFGNRNYFDYYKIGGFESFVRRIALELISNGNEVHYILYNAQKENELEVFPNLILKYFTNYGDAINSVSKEYRFLIDVWIDKPHRIHFLNFCKALYPEIQCIYLWLNFPDSFYKRILKLMELKCFSLYGRAVCISPRQYKYVKKVIRDIIFIFPPVPEDYFLTPAEKPVNKRIKVVYLGELTPMKYIEEVIQLFNWLRNDTRFKCIIYGTYDPRNKNSVEIHNFLKSQNFVEYIHIPKEKYSPKVDELVKKVLKETDIFIQPYKSLVNTLDTPLLLLEAMASLCVVVTTPIGSISEIYGKSQFLIDKANFLESVKNLFNNLTYKQILYERRRIFNRNQELKFNLKDVYKTFNKLFIK